MGRKRKQQGGSGSAVPSTSKSAKQEVSSSSASLASTSIQGGTGGGGSRSAGLIAPQGSDSGQEISGQLHPLLNPVVLSNLFSFCPPGLLANCRLVCKTWRHDSLPAWRSSATPQFAYKGNKDVKGVVAGERSSKTSLFEFLNFWEKECSTLPYQNFHLAYWKFGIPVAAKQTRSQGQTERLFQLMGSHAKKLTLERCTFLGATDFRRVIYQSFPNLQTLILVGLRLSDYPPLVQQPENNPASLEPIYGEQIHLKSISLRYFHRLTIIPVSCVELLTHFPSLTSVSVSGSPWEWMSISMDVIRSLLEAVRMIRDRDVSKVLKICLGAECPLGLSQELFDLTRQFAVPMSSIRISLSCGVNLVENFLTSQWETLTKIEIFKGTRRRRRRRPTANLQFPFGVKLNNLQELIICAEFCRNMEFLRYTSNLRKLRIFNMVTGDAYGSGELVPLKTGLVSSTGESLGDVKLSTLKYLYFGYKLSRDDLNRLFILFPNLEILTAFLDDELLAVVCENWTNLKHLHILGEEMTDEGVTGMELQPDIETGAVRPNVTYLKALECFQMESSRSGLTDAAALHGLLKLPKLRRLEIPRCGHRFGRKVKGALLFQNIPDRETCRLELDHGLWIPSNGERDWCPDFAGDDQSF